MTGELAALRKIAVAAVAVVSAYNRTSTAPVLRFDIAGAIKELESAVLAAPEDVLLAAGQSALLGSGKGG